MNQMQNIGLYLHIPFCLKKCIYCDFFSVASSDEKLKKSYISAIIREMALHRKKNQGVKLTSIYLGGGTPTVLSGLQLQEILGACFSKYPIDEMAEITIEANPGTIDLEKCKLLFQAGANRLSLGVQSSDDKMLKKLGRIHTTEDSLAAYHSAREAGFKNINIDIMFGLPNQSKIGFEETLTEVIKLKPEHISLYALSLEPETPLGHLVATGKIKLPSDDFTNKLFLRAIALLGENNYEHYEISNFALPGKRCIHNQLYWNYQPYLGLGAGAATFMSNKRYRNYQDLELYIELLNFGIIPIEYQEMLSSSERMSERVILKLRMMEGLSRAEFKELFGAPIEHFYGKPLQDLKEQGLLAESKTRYYLTKKGISLANNVFLEFLD